MCVCASNCLVYLGVCVLLQICKQVNMSRWYINIIETGVELLIAKAWRGRVGERWFGGGGLLLQ